MPFSKGQAIVVREGIMDEDTGVSLAGWTGQIMEVEEDLLLIEWDAATLADMPPGYISDSVDSGHEFKLYWIEQAEVIAAAARPATATGDWPALKSQLIAGLKEIGGSGGFVASGEADFVPPGLEVEGFGEIALPLVPLQAQALLKFATAAPYGKGSKTITDPSVRSAWEIDGSQLRFHNPAWGTALDGLLKAIKEQMGLEDAKVTASLYKLLLYQAGDFFLPHKDSEKEAGMFATLTIALPSKHSGGELLVRFDGREEKVDFSEAASQYLMPFAAFYADCEHEIKPVQSGYRICLVYNLLQSANGASAEPLALSQSAVKLGGLLEQLKPSFGAEPLIVLLDHQYTPANFSLSQLKGDDRARTQALLAAAEQAGYYAKAGLLTHYVMGDLEGDDYYYSRRYDDEESESSMGEIHEEYTTAEHWAADGPPGLGNLNIDPTEILPNLDVGDDEPLEREKEEYTGNAGMTMEYWYHYGAIFLWPKAQQAKVLASLSAKALLQWLQFYQDNWGDARHAPQAHTRQILETLANREKPSNNYWQKYPTDYSPAAAGLVRLGDAGFASSVGTILLGKYFCNLPAARWPALVKAYGTEVFQSVFKKAGPANKLETLVHLLEVLQVLDRAGQRAFVCQQLRGLPASLKAISFHNTHQYEQANAVLAVKRLIELSSCLENDEATMAQLQQSICAKISRPYVNEVLVPLLLAKECPQNRFTELLREACLADLEERTAVKPAPPSNWRRKTPQLKYYKEVWDLLRPFLSSPTQTTFDYAARQDLRSRVESALRSVEIDLQATTIRQGSPHTLRLTKTQAAYEKALKQWKEDMELKKIMVEQGA